MPTLAEIEIDIQQLEIIARNKQMNIVNQDMVRILRRLHSVIWEMKIEIFDLQRKNMP